MGFSPSLFSCKQTTPRKNPQRLPLRFLANKKAARRQQPIVFIGVLETIRTSDVRPLLGEIDSHDSTGISYSDKDRITGDILYLVIYLSPR